MAHDPTSRYRVSIHAPREGCDTKIQWFPARELRFNSRTPGGVRPRRALNGAPGEAVSIHAPREGCDDFILSPWSA